MLAHHHLPPPSADQLQQQHQLQPMLQLNQQPYEGCYYPPAVMNYFPPQPQDQQHQLYTSIIKQEGPLVSSPLPFSWPQQLIPPMSGGGVVASLANSIRTTSATFGNTNFNASIGGNGGGSTIPDQKSVEEERKKGPVKGLHRKRRRLKSPSSAATATEGVGPMRKKMKNIVKEHERNVAMKGLVKELEQWLRPFLPRANLPRIRVLRLTMAYIEHMQNILRGDLKYCGCGRCPEEREDGWRPLRRNDFLEQVSREMQTANSYKQRAEDEVVEDGSECSYSHSGSEGKKNKKKRKRWNGSGAWSD